MPVDGNSHLQMREPGSILGAGFRHERFLLFAFETRDPHDPTSPRREASLFDSPGLLARRLFLGRGSPYAPVAFCRPGHNWDVVPLVWETPQTPQAIDLEGVP